MTSFKTLTQLSRVAVMLAAGAILLTSFSAMAAGSSSGYGMGGFEGLDSLVAQYNRSGELFGSVSV
jgi:hypothetical protein